MATGKYFLYLFVLSLVSKMVLSIKCLDCNSVNNSMCLDPTLYDSEALQKYLRLVDCQAGVFSPTPQDFFCRKIVQTVLHKHHDPDVRVTRGCGWVRHAKPCYQADTEDHLETVCQCFSDGCNHAATLRSSSGHAALVTVLTALLYKH